MLAANGIGVHPDYSFTRVLNGFSAALDPRAVALLQREPEVAGIYPVRAAYPATVSSAVLESKQFARGQGRRPDVDLPGFNGRGVTIALLDTGVDRSQPYLHGRVARGIDLVDRGSAGRARTDPQDPRLRERHGTQLAGPARRIRRTRRPAGRRAGRDAAADPRRGLAARRRRRYGGVRALRPADRGPRPRGRPERRRRRARRRPRRARRGRRAVRRVRGRPRGARCRRRRRARHARRRAGRQRRRGRARPSARVSGPGGAPAALTVAATDARVQTPSARVVLRRGLQVIDDRVEPLLGSVTPSRALTLDVGSPRAAEPDADASGTRLLRPPRAQPRRRPRGVRSHRRRSRRGGARPRCAPAPPRSSSTASGFRRGRSGCRTRSACRS